MAIKIDAWLWTELPAASQEQIRNRFMEDVLMTMAVDTSLLLPAEGEFSFKHACAKLAALRAMYPIEKVREYILSDRELLHMLHTLVDTTTTRSYYIKPEGCTVINIVQLFQE